jgi:ABC-type lipoprotein release transport system permease subunit
MVIGSVSWLLAVVVSIPLTLLTMDRLRTVVVQPLVLDWSQSAAVAWLAIALGVAAIASVYPARRAARFRVTAALAHN